jgi:cation diffusion facilitator CzcD-associated flavoprotein CzcO
VGEQAFSTIALFEQRRAVGGVWNATPHVVTDGAFAIPSTAPSAEPRAPVWSRGAGNDENGEGRVTSERFEFISPVYDDLETNIPHPLMRYSDLAFPDGSVLYPRHDAVREYLERYADDVRHLIRFGTQVRDVHPVDDDDGEGGCRWSVMARDLKTGEETTLMFDAVVVANGHYDDPFVPDIPGIGEWDAAYPGSILHSKFYRRPSEYEGKVCLLNPRIMMCLC